jgi:hypothetical protein
MSVNLLLTSEELVAITGYRRARDQVAWIRDHYGIFAHVNAVGEAVVLRAHLQAANVPTQTVRSVRQVRKSHE